MLNKKIIWQPELVLTGCGFNVFLDKRFAKEMLDSPLSYENQRNMNELGAKDLKSLGIDWREPYAFQNNSCLIGQIYLGMNGVWLSTSPRDLNNLVKEKDLKGVRDIEYGSHNVDTPRNAYALMYLFSKWIEYADVLKGLDKK